MNRRSGEKKWRFFCSWSGGKDAALAMHRALLAGGDPAGLLTMMTLDGTRSRSHGLASSVLAAQSRSLGVPLTAAPTTWDSYEERFHHAVRDYGARGVTRGVFGDIDFDRNRAWAEGACAACGVEAIEPLWGEPRSTLLEEFFSAGFEARIVALREDSLPRDYLGRRFTPRLVEKLAGEGIDASGELGEYHTVVFDGPIFSRPLALQPGRQVLRDGYWFQDFQTGPGDR